MHYNTKHVQSAIEKTSIKQQIKKPISEKKSGRVFVDLESHGINYENVCFDTGQKGRGEKSITIRQETFDQLIEIVKLASLKSAFLLLIFKKVLMTHRPRMYSTFNRMAAELETDPCVLRRYAKSFQKSGYIVFDRLSKEEEKQPDEYIFSMGPHFKHWLWTSNLFLKLKSNYCTRKGVDNYTQSEDNFNCEKNQTDHNGLSEKTKQTTTDCLEAQTDHDGLSVVGHVDDIINKSLKKIPLTYDLRTYGHSLPYEEKPKEGETNVQKRRESKTTGIIPKQLLWLKETSGEIPFSSWEKMQKC